MKRFLAPGAGAAHVLTLLVGACQPNQVPHAAPGSQNTPGSTATAHVPVSQVVVEPQATPALATASVAPAVPKATPSPTQATLKQCIDDGWLLTNFPVQDLVDKKHHAICCKEGALLGTEEAFRCSLDWPTNDVPACKLWLHLAAVLKDNNKNRPASELVLKNLAKLEEYAKTKYSCSP